MSPLAEMRNAAVENTMLLRFVVDVLDPDSGRRRGVFHAAFELRDSKDVTAADHRRLVELTDWFNEHLERPESLSVSGRPNAKAQAISWFKDTATAHIGRAWEFTDVLAGYGIAVEVIRTRRPGYIVYEDDFQVTAYPFADTPT